MAEHRRGISNWKCEPARRAEVFASTNQSDRTPVCVCLQITYYKLLIHLSVDPLHPLGNAGKYFPGDRSRFRGELRGQDRLLTLRPHQDRFFANVHRFEMRNVSHDLVHGDSAKERTAPSADEHFRLLA